MNWARVSALTTALLGTSLGVLACTSCSSPSEAPPADGGVAPDAKSDAVVSKPDASPDSASGDGGDAGTDAVVDPYVPPDVPAGWEPWTAWSKECPLYVPGKNGKMPEPIEWEACPAPVPASLACKRMKINWGGYAATFPTFALDPKTGAPLLQVKRFQLGGDDSHILHLVAEADGPVRNALYQRNASYDCQFFDQGLADGRFILRPITTRKVGGQPLKEEGVLGGDVDAPTPSVVVQMPADPSIHANWSISSDWLVERRAHRKAWTWDGKPAQTIYDPATDPEGFLGGIPVVRGKDVFVNVGSSSGCGVMSWDATQGTRPLLRWPGDASKGATMFGTDGKQMVWTQYAQGCDSVGEVWTAPYTIEPAEVKAKAVRLRKDFSTMSVNGTWAVGFGYAARTVTKGLPHSLYVVRLADGAAWVVPGAPSVDALSFLDALGFTNDEVFTSASMIVPVGTVGTILRIRLDSLGTPLPPD